MSMVRESRVGLLLSSSLSCPGWRQGCSSSFHGFLIRVRASALASGRSQRSQPLRTSHRHTSGCHHGRRGTELRGTTGRTPELHRQTDALEIERSNPTLEPLPTDADQDLPTPSGPTALKKLSHTFFLRELLQGGRAAGSTGRVGEPETPDSPKESIN